MLRSMLGGALALAIGLAVASPGWAGPADLAPHVPGEIIIKFRADAGPVARTRVLDGLGARQVERVGRGEWRRVVLRDLDVSEALRRYAGHPDVAWVEPNYLLRAALLPNDQNFAAQWGLQNHGQSGGVPGADISATSAWDVTVGSPGVVIAIIDSGVDVTHPDLSPNIFINSGEIQNNGVDDDNNGFIDDIYGWDFLSNDNNPRDDNGHGTHVAGTAGAVGNNGLGIAGVSWRSKLLPCKFLNAEGFGTLSAAIGCIDYSILMGADIINASWGGVGSQALREAVQRTTEAGVVFVAAAGNTNGGNNNDFIPFFPSSYDYPNVISVAATDDEDLLWRDSHYGVNTVDLAAPGVTILSTVPDGYAFFSGTSMAAPHVAGVAALVKARFPEIDAPTLRSLILSRVDPLLGLQGRVGSGGRLNAFATVVEQDDAAPAGIVDLAVEDPDATRVDLVWTAPGDDGDEGNAARYDVRYADVPITPATFETAIPLASPSPRPAGEGERLRVSGLLPDRTWYFAVKAFDEVNNASPLSNVASGTTLGPPDIRVEPTALDAELITGQRTSRSLTLHNDGEGEYTFRIASSRPTETAAAEPSADPAETNSPRGATPSLPRAGGSWGPPRTLPRDGAPAIVAGAEPAEGFRLLILESGSNVAEIRDALALFQDIAVVDVFSGRTTPPTLDQLRPYDAVVLVANLPFENAATVGNVLADYVDGGGGLVLTLASFIVGWQVEGRFLNDGYYPLNLGSGPIAGDDLGAYDPNHPIMAGVSAARAELLGNVTVAPGADLVASWQNGQPAVATRRGNVAAVNVFLAGQGFWSGDVPLIVHNAALWTSNVVPWLAASPGEGIVPAGESLEVAVTFDARGLNGGSYTAELRVRGDDPDTPDLAVPARLQVIGAPDIEAVPAAVEFGTTFVGGAVVRPLVVANVGSERLRVSSASSDHPDFATNPGGFELGPGESRQLELTFRPATSGLREARLSLASDDPDEAVLVVPLTGTGLIPPDIAVAPPTLHDTLVSGETSTHTLFVRNEGGSDLVFELRREVIGAAGATGTAGTSTNRRGGVTLRPLAAAAGPASAAASPFIWNGGPTPALDTAAPAGTPDGPFEFVEDFEDGDHDGWQVVNSSNFKTVTDFTAADGTVYSYTQWNRQAGHFNGIYQTLPAVNPEYVGFWIRSHSTETNDAYFVMRGATGQEAIFFFAQDDGQLYINADVGGNTLVGYEADTWYFIEFRDIDWVERTFDYHVDSRLIQEDIPFRFAAEVVNLHRVDLYNFDDDAEAWWDQILITDNPPAQAVRLDPQSGVVPAGESFEVAVRFDSRGLLAGDHVTNIEVRSNDPDEPMVVVPTLLNVIGSPDIEFPAGVPDFGEVYAGVRAERLLVVANEGTDRLEISSAAFDHPEFSVAPSSLGLEPDERGTLALTFDPSGTGTRTATLTLISDDPDENPLTLTFTARVVEPPRIAVDPARIDQHLFTGERITRRLTVHNNGGSDLVFDVETETVVQAAAPRPPPPAVEPDRGVAVEGPVSPDQIPAGLRPPVPALAAAAEFTFHDGFEDGDFDSWGNQGGTGIKEVTDLTAADGTTFSYHESNAPGGHLTGIYQPLDNARPAYVGFWIRSGDTTTADGYVVFRNPDGLAAIFFFANPVGQFYINADVGGNAVVSYLADTWYHIEFKNVDFDLKRFDYWVDGEQIQERIPFRNASLIDGLAQVDLYSFETGAEAFWDEITISTREPVDRLTVEPLAGNVRPGESIDLDVTLDARRHQPGTAEFIVRLHSNDPLAPSLAVPVVLEVTGAPDIAIAQDRLDFGTRFTGTATTIPLAVSNEGSLPLTVLEASSGDPEFTVEPAALTVPPGESAVLTVTFRPQIAGLHETALTLRSDDPDEEVVTVALRGLAAAPPDIDIEPDGFDETLLTAEVAVRPLVVRNDGLTPLVWSVFFEPVRPSWFDAAPRGGTIAPGQAVEIALAFDMRGQPGGALTSSLRIESNDPDEPVVRVPVQVTVVAAPVIAVAPDPLRFNDAFLGGPSNAALAVSNHGFAALRVTGITADEPQLAVAPSEFTVLPGETATAVVTFTPSALGTFTGRITVRSDDPFRPTVEVVARAEVKAPPDVEVGPLEGFDEKMLSGQIRTRTLRVDNLSGSPLTFVVHVTGSGPAASSGGEDPAPADPEGHEDEPVPSLPAWLAPMATLGPPSGDLPRTLPEVRPKQDTTLIFGDDFEDGELSDSWTLPDSDSLREISNVAAADLSRLSFREFNSEAGHLTGIHRLLGATQPGYVGFWVRPTLAGANSGYFVLRDAQLNEAIFFFLTELGRMYVNADVGGDFSIPYQANTWYFIEFKNIDFALQRFDYFVNFQRIKRGVRFRNFGGIHEFARVDLYNFTEGSDAFWDEIVFATENPFDGLRVRPRVGQVPAGTGLMLDATFDSRNLIEGHYAAEIKFGSNDPDEPEIVIPAALQVIGIPDMGLSVNSLDFGEVLIGVGRSRSVTVTNFGTTTLAIREVLVDHPEFTASVESFELAPDRSRSVTVTWDPSAPGPGAARLTLISNDPDRPTVEVPMSGVARAPAHIDLAPDLLVTGVREALYFGQSSTRTIPLANSGGATLDYTFDLRTPDGLAIPSEVLLFEDTADSGGAGWTTEVYAGEDLWHLTPRDAHSGESSWWCGAETTGHYGTAHPVNTALVSPPLDLRGIASPVRLSFWENYETETPYDQCMVDISTDGGESWIPLRGVYGGAPSGSSRGWIKTNIPINSYAGKVVRVRFAFRTLDANNNAWPGWFVDDVQIVAQGTPYARVTGISGSLPPGGGGEIVLTFDARSLRPQGVYPGRVRIVSNDPFLPVADVPVALEVASPPRIALAGATVTVESDTDTKAGRSHVLPIGSLPAGDGTLTLVAEGDYDAAAETATLTAESFIGGSVGGSGATCGEARGEFAVPAATLRDLARDGRIDVDVRDSAHVDPAECASRRQTVRLSYPAPLELLDFGALRPGENRDLPLRVVNFGASALEVTGVALPSSALQVSQTSFSVPARGEVALTVTWVPAAVGALGGEIRLSSNDPFSPQIAVRVAGTVEAAPPRAEIEADGLVAALPPHGDVIKTRTVRLANVGDRPLVWSAGIAPVGSVAPASGSVAPGDVAELTLRFAAAGLDEGDYDVVLAIETNDPLRPLIELPVALHVREAQLSSMNVDLTPKFAVRPGTVEVALQLPPGHDPSEIDLSTVEIHGVPPDAAPVVIRDLNRDGRPELILQFDTARLAATLPPSGSVEITVRGEVRDRTWFRGSRFVRGIVVLEPPAKSGTRRGGD